MANDADSMEIMSTEVLSDAAACLKVMAHPVRLQIADILAQGDLSVRELAGLCGVQEHQICGHLRLMQRCGLLESERQGRSVHYKIASPQLRSLIKCVRANCGKSAEHGGNGND